MYIDPNPKVEEKRAEYRDELMKNEKLWEYYNEYKKESVEALIDSYALTKARLRVQGNYTRNHHEKLVKEWTSRAWHALCEIQHKKLFDIQCRWRAGEIKELPGIKWTFDFAESIGPILDCEILPDITSDEVEEYIRFLKTPQGEVWLNYGLGEHQSHAMVKQCHLEGKGFMPEYYEYHYTIHGNTGLLSLPDIRDEEEQRLMRLVYNINKQDLSKKKQEETPEVTEPPKKYLIYSDDEVSLKLAEFLGEKDVAGFIKDLAKWVKEKPDTETDWAMDYLSSCYPDEVPVPAASRWQDAVERAVLQHITLKLHEILPVVYEEYLIKKQLGNKIGDVGKEISHRTITHPLIYMLELGERIDNGEQIDQEEIMRGFLSR